MFLSIYSCLLSCLCLFLSVDLDIHLLSCPLVHRTFSTCYYESLLWINYLRRYLSVNIFISPRFL